MARRGLMPILVLLVVAPPRVCTCDHDHVLPSQAAVLDYDGLTPHHPHGPGPADDPDCPCVQPSQVKATGHAASVTMTPPAASPILLSADVCERTRTGPPASDPGIGDPPLFLTGCALRF